jgi:hypothetical protein
MTGFNIEIHSTQLYRNCKLEITVLSNPKNIKRVNTSYYLLHSHLFSSPCQEA